MYRLVREPIDIEALQRSLIRPEDGAVVVFLGTVRNHSHGRKVLFLEYEAYEKMALKKLEEVGTRAKELYPVTGITIVHRLGRLEHRDCSVAILITSAHRAPALDACRFAIDTLKKTVPIWKKEFYEDGECWIEGAE